VKNSLPRVILGAVLALLILNLIGYGQQRETTTTAPCEAGRFQLFLRPENTKHLGSVYRIDTQTGATWMHSAGRANQADPKTFFNVWVPIDETDQQRKVQRTTP